MVRDLEAMRQSPVTADVLCDAKAALPRRIPSEESSVSGIAPGILHRIDLELPLDEPTLAARRWLATDALAVQRAFRRRIRPTPLVEVAQGPAPR